MLFTPLFTVFTLAIQGAPQPPAPFGGVPHPRQLAWQELETCAFVHFGMNTFTDVEWGTGSEDPRTFAPAQLDPRQWAAVFREAGLRGVVITAKHHDGFCLWPTETTEHSVAASPWREGRGDLLAELAAACRAEGLRFGVYLSPWDRNHPAYADSKRYDDVFCTQLREVLTRYGPVFEVWFDRAKPAPRPGAAEHVYDWKRYVALVRELQPEAVIFSDSGPDIRWVGNEQGYAGETCWSTFDLSRAGPGRGDRLALSRGVPGGPDWVPAECDVSIRPSWFHHPSEDGRVRSVEELVALYERTVGRNASLLLNVPPDRRGLIPEAEAERLRTWRAVLTATYDEDLARGRPVFASNVRGGAPRFGAQRAVDGDPETFWATDDGVAAASLVVDLEGARRLDRVALGEAIRLGQRIAAFTLDAETEAGWRRVAEGTTIGRKRIVVFEPLTARRLRLAIARALACPTLARFEAYLEPPRVRAEVEASDFLESTRVTLSASLPEAVIRYTLDGSEPAERSPIYEAPLVIDRDATLRAAAWLGGERSPFEARVTLRRWDPEKLLPAVHLFRAPEPGLAYRAWAARMQRLADIEGVRPAREGVSDGLDLDARLRDEHAALEFRGYLRAPTDGVYRFHLTSDDGSRLWLHEELLIDHDGLHGMTTRSAAVGLAAGLHPLRVEWFNATGGLGLRLEWEGPGIARAAVPAEAFRH